MTPTVMVVPTKNRPEFLADCVASLDGQAEQIIVVNNNAYPPPAPPPSTASTVWVIQHEQYPPNLSLLWNLGIDQATETAHEYGWPQWNVLVVNDDIVAPPGLVHALSQEMRATSAVCAFPDQFGTGSRVLHRVPQPTRVQDRICGYCFMLRGETGIRADEELRWWFGDDDIDWRARQAGGSLLVPGVSVVHRAPDVQTRADPVLSEQTNTDHKTWKAKWGHDRPVIM